MHRQGNHHSCGEEVGVAIIEPTGGHVGAHYYDFGLCLGLLQAGCCVSLFTCDETADPAIPGLDFCPFYRGVFVGKSRWRKGYRYFIGTFKSLRRSLSMRERICHFHVYNALLPELLVMSMARLFRRKIVLTVHDVDCLIGPATKKRRITGWLYKKSDRIIVHNKYSMHELSSIGVPASKGSVIPHGHYLDTMQPLPRPADARRALGIAETGKVILFFGQIKDVKGLDILIASMPEVIGEIPDAVLLIAGRPWGTDFSRYDKLIDEGGIRPQCHLHIRYIADHEVATFYGAADVVALPYRRIYQSGVLIMAMTYGRPVVVSDLPGMTDIVTDGSNGYVFSDGSPQALALSLIRALRDDRERGEISRRSIEYIRQHHDWTGIGRSTAEVYRSVLAS
jgi:glycosyltransferase involved in cell wall biosynthesis